MKFNDSIRLRFRLYKPINKNVIYNTC